MVLWHKIKVYSYRIPFKDREPKGCIRISKKMKLITIYRNLKCSAKVQTSKMTDFANQHEIIDGHRSQRNTKRLSHCNKRK